MAKSKGPAKATGKSQSTTAGKWGAAETAMDASAEAEQEKKPAAEPTDMDAEAEEAGDVFPDVMEIPRAPKLPERTYQTRYDFKIKIPASDKGEMTKSVVDAIRSIWDAIKDLDKSLVVYPWEEDSEEKPISKFDKVSTTSLSEIRVFFHKAQPREKGGVMYFSAFLGHEKKFKKLHCDISDWKEAF